MQKLFTEITKWQKVTFPSSTPKSKLKHLQKEVIEVEEDIETNSQVVIFELADIIILTFGIADQLGITYQGLTKAIDQKLQINKMRKWQEPDKDGVVFHVKD